MIQSGLETHPPCPRASLWRCWRLKRVSPALVSTLPAWRVSPALSWHCQGLGLEPFWSNLLLSSKDQPGSETCQSSHSRPGGQCRDGDGQAQAPAAWAAVLCADFPSLACAPAVQGTWASSLKGLSDHTPKSQCSVLSDAPAVHISWPLTSIPSPSHSLSCFQRSEACPAQTVILPQC